MAMLRIDDFKPFVPSNDYDESKAFYQAIGFGLNWESDEACEIDTHFGYRFFLLPNNHNNYAHSLMLHFMVPSAREWYDHFDRIGLVDRFDGVRVAPPELMPWGLIVCHVWDPAGVLLHFAENPGRDD